MQNKAMVFVGCDPGQTGAISFIHTDGRVNIIPMPVTKSKVNGKNKTKLNILALSSILEDIDPANSFLVMEIQQAMRRPLFATLEGTNERIMVDEGDVQGTSASFNNGYGYGILKGLITAYKIPHECVAAQKWQSKIFPNIRSQGTKPTSIETAKRLYPNVSLRLNPDNARETTDKHGLSDSLLIAHYAKLIYNRTGGLNVATMLLGGEDE